MMWLPHISTLLHNTTKKSRKMKYNCIILGVLFNEQFTNEEKWGNVTCLVVQYKASSRKLLQSLQPNVRSNAGEVTW